MMFEGYEYRKNEINIKLKQIGLNNLQEAKNICESKGIDIFHIVESAQPICENDAKWAYTLGAAMVIKKEATEVTDITKIIGEALQAFTIPDSVANKRNIGVGHGNLAAMLLDETVKTFAFLAGHESFAAAEGAIKISEYANQVRKTELNVILLGLGKDAARIISRINGFTYVKTRYHDNGNQLIIESKELFSKKNRLKIKCYGAESVDEGVEIMMLENVDVSITGNSTNPTRFQHPVAGIYKQRCIKTGKKYFSVASGGGTGRTLHPDNMAAGPASYGMTDTMGKMHADVQFAGSSSVPAHVKMMGYIGMGNNPMVGATVAVTVALKNAVKNLK
jgi:hypothetical protein